MLAEMLYRLFEKIRDKRGRDPFRMPFPRKENLVYIEIVPGRITFLSLPEKYVERTSTRFEPPRPESWLLVRQVMHTEQIAKLLIIVEQSIE